MDLATIKAALALAEAGESFVQVSALETTGSSPRHAGASMIVRVDGSTVGTVGGGPLEARAVETALEALRTRASRLMHFELTNADAAGLGMICGGRGILLIEYVDPASASKRGLYRALLDLLTAGGTGWLVTGVSSEVDGGLAVRSCLVDSTGKATGDPVCPAETLRGLALAGGALDGHTAGDRPGIYVQPVGAAGTAYIFGAGHCGLSLAPLLSMVGFRTVVVDDRAALADPERFPTADRILVPDSFDGALEGLPVDRQSYLVIMTRGHAHDRAVLEQALRTEAGYIGMIGSTKKISGIFQALRERGFSEADLARVHAPIGLAIGAETPEEIAVSIAAEMIQVRRTRTA